MNLVGDALRQAKRPYVVRELRFSLLVHTYMMVARRV
jgi:hypothetical protein